MRKRNCGVVLMESISKSKSKSKSTILAVNNSPALVVMAVAGSGPESRRGERHVTLLVANGNGNGINALANNSHSVTATTAKTHRAATLHRLPS